MAEEFDRVQPHDNEAEVAVLGSMLLTVDAIVDVTEEIRGSDFYSMKHEIVFDAIVELFGQNQVADPITVSDKLQHDGTLTKIGGRPYLHTLMASVPTAANAGYYARIVREKSIMRRLVSAGTRVVQLGYSEEGAEIDELVDQAQQEIFAVATDRASTDYVSMNTMVNSLVEHLEAIQKNDDLFGVPTGFTDLDDLTQGLKGGQMIIVAARPAMGKSTFALDFCRSASIKHDITSLIFSLEMSQQEIAMRMVSAESGVPLTKMQKGTMNDDDWRKVANTIGKVAQSPLYVDDSANITMTEIRSKCRQLKQEQNLGLVVVDYLQLMTTGGKAESRQQEVSQISRSLKLLAKEVDVPVVAVAQLNRKSEERTDKRPMMSDLRESGSLEQDADIIMLLHRPDYYNEDDRPGEAEIHVVKHRAGATKTITALFQGHLARFANYTRREED